MKCIPTYKIFVKFVHFKHCKTKLVRQEGEIYGGTGAIVTYNTGRYDTGTTYFVSRYLRYGTGRIPTYLGTVGTRYQYLPYYTY